MSSRSKKPRRKPEAFDRRKEPMEGCPTPGKTAFTTRAAAKSVMRQWPGNRRSAGHKLAVYHCACGAFHIGNKLKGESRESYRERNEATT